MRWIKGKEKKGGKNPFAYLIAGGVPDGINNPLELCGCVSTNTTIKTITTQGNSKTKHSGIEKEEVLRIRILRLINILMRAMEKRDGEGEEDALFGGSSRPGEEEEEEEESGPDAREEYLVLLAPGGSLSLEAKGIRETMA